MGNRSSGSGVCGNVNPAVTSPVDPATVPVSGTAVAPDPDRDRVLASCWREEYGRLVGLARLLVDRPHEAEEVVQEAFVKVYAGWRRVDDKANPLPYLRMTVVNVARSGLRRRVVERRHRERPRREELARSAEDSAADRARDARLVAAVRTLPRRQREAVALRYLEELSTAEAAQAMGCSEGSVKAYLHRALSSLRTELEER